MLRTTVRLGVSPALTAEERSRFDVNPENLHQGEGIQVEEVTLETENIHHPAEEAVKVIFIGHRPMNGRNALDSPGITGLVQK